MHGAWLTPETMLFPLKVPGSQETLQSSRLLPIFFLIHTFNGSWSPANFSTQCHSHPALPFIPITPDLVWWWWLLNQSPHFILVPSSPCEPQINLPKTLFDDVTPWETRKGGMGLKLHRLLSYAMLCRELLRLGKELLIKWGHPQSRKVSSSQKIHI